MSRTRDLSPERITASVRTSDGHSHQARVARSELCGDDFYFDLNFGGATPSLEDGEEVVLSFSGNRISGRPTTRSSYVPDVAGLPRGCIRFHVDLCSRGGLSGLIERRGADRVRMTSVQLASIQLSESKLEASWTGALLDISSRGMQLGFPARNDPCLQPGQRVRVEFTLQGDSEPFRFEAQLQYRIPGRGRVAYGMEFASEGTEADQGLEGRLFGVIIGLICETAA